MMNRTLVSWSLGIIAGICVGGSILMAQEIGGIDNIVQTIRSVVITNDGQPAVPSRFNVIMWMNDPTAGPDNEVRIRPGAFRNKSIAYEDIDWDTWVQHGVQFCPSDQALVSIDSAGDPVCITPQGGYWSAFDNMYSSSIYYDGKVGIGPRNASATADGVQDVVAAADAADLSLVGNVQIDGDLTVGSSATDGLHVSAIADTAVIDPDGDLSIGLSPDGVRTTDTPVAIGSASIPRVSSPPPDLSVDVGDPMVYLAVGYDGLGASGMTLAHDDRLTVMNAYGALHVNTRPAGHTVLGTTRPLYIGGADMADDYLAGSPTSSPWSSVYAAPTGPAWSTQVVIGSLLTPLDYADGAIAPSDADGLVVDGIASFRGHAERGGLQFQQMDNTSTTYQLSGMTTDGAQLGCSILSVDDDGNVVLRKVPDCGVWSDPPPSESCGPDAGGTFDSVGDMDELCDGGVPTSVTLENGTYTWQCLGENSSSPLCTANQTSSSSSNNHYACTSAGFWYDITSLSSCDLDEDTVYDPGQIYNSGQQVCVSASSIQPDSSTCVVCEAPVITQADFQLTEFPSVGPGMPNAIFNLDFDDSTYMNAQIQVFIGSSPITSTTETNTSPASGGIFGNTTYNIRLNAECVSNGVSVNSNTISVVGSQSPNNPNSCTAANRIWIDGSSFDWGGVGYQYFDIGQNSVDPMTDFEDTCGGYVVYDNMRHKHECIPNGTPSSFGSDIWGHYLINEGSSAAFIRTSASGDPNTFVNTPFDYTPAGPLQPWILGGSYYTRLVPFASACNS